MRKKLCLFCIILIIFMILPGCDKGEIIEKHTGETVVTLGKDIITTGDIDRLKEYRKNNISYEEALEILVERAVLYKEAKAQKIKIDMKEIEKETKEARDLFRKYGTEKDRKNMDNVFKELEITEKEYWENYYPKTLAKLTAIAKMKKKIMDKIYGDIIKNHSNWGQPEIEKESTEAYGKILEELKKKHKVKYTG